MRLPVLSSRLYSSSRQSKQCLTNGYFEVSKLPWQMLSMRLHLALACAQGLVTADSSACTASLLGSMQAVANMCTPTCSCCLSTSRLLSKSVSSVKHKALKHLLTSSSSQIAGWNNSSSHYSSKKQDSWPLRINHWPWCVTAWQILLQAMPGWRALCKNVMQHQTCEDRPAVVQLAPTPACPTGLAS